MTIEKLLEEGVRSLSVSLNENDAIQILNPDLDETELKKLQVEYDTQAYSRKREAEYPSIQECIHAILDDQLDALQAKRASIKTKYPKGE